jgi:hypothetical protein
MPKKLAKRYILEHEDTKIPNNNSGFKKIEKSSFILSLQQTSSTEPRVGSYTSKEHDVPLDKLIWDIFFKNMLS